jgi:hypothetical protein
VGEVSVVEESERERDEQAKKALRLLRSRREQERHLPFDFWNDDDDDRTGIASGRRREEENTRAHRNPRKPAGPILDTEKRVINPDANQSPGSYE